MSVYDKLKSIAISSGKQLPLAGIFIDAVESERSRVKQENLEGVVQHLGYYIEELQIDMNINSEPETSKMISTILKEVEDEYEVYMKEAYANLLVHIVADNSKKQTYSNIIYQLQNMNGRDISALIEMYSYKIAYKEKFKGKSMKESIKVLDPGMTDEKLNEIEKLNGIDLSTQVVEGPSSIREEDFDKVTVKKFESIGLLQIPRNVKGFEDSTEMYRPSLSRAADDFYTYCIKKPE